MKCSMYSSWRLSTPIKCIQDKHMTMHKSTNWLTSKQRISTAKKNWEGKSLSVRTYTVQAFSEVPLS